MSDNLQTGRADVTPSKPSHVRGVRPGNRKRKPRRGDGLKPVGDGATATARRSTGINADDREPIDERMPNLPPA